MPDLTTQLQAIEGVRVSEGAALAEHVSMAVGGPARWLVIVDDVAALPVVLRILRASGEHWMMLGGGSNTVFGDKGYAGAVVKLGKGFRLIERGPGPHQVTAGAGAMLSAVMNFAGREGLGGLEWAAGVPGMLGGALAGNAGAGPGDTCSLVASVEVIDAAGKRVIRQRGEFAYAYRKSSLREDVILRATLDLCPDDAAAIKARKDAALAKRGTQPIGKSCAGCMFKNPEGNFAGRLIDQAGLKGLRVGGASVSAQHANFVINDGTATAAEIMALCEEIRQKVLAQTGVDLHLEIRMVELDSPPEIR